MFICITITWQHGCGLNISYRPPHTNIHTCGVFNRTLDTISAAAYQTFSGNLEDAMKHGVAYTVCEFCDNALNATRSSIQSTYRIMPVATENDRTFWHVFAFVDSGLTITSCHLSECVIFEVDHYTDHTRVTRPAIGDQWPGLLKTIGHYLSWTTEKRTTNSRRVQYIY